MNKPTIDDLQNQRLESTEERLRILLEAIDQDICEVKENLRDLRQDIRLMDQRVLQIQTEEIPAIKVAQAELTGKAKLLVGAVSSITGLVSGAIAHFFGIGG